jgi:hypothetical protein
MPATATQVYRKQGESHQVINECKKRQLSAKAVKMNIFFQSN